MIIIENVEIFFLLLFKVGAAKRGTSTRERVGVEDRERRRSRRFEGQ